MIDSFGLFDNQMRFLPGWFEDTLPSAPIKKLAILRIDGDLYESTMDALRNLYDKVSPNGYTIIDDYSAMPACRAATEDFREERGIKGELHMVDNKAVFWSKTG